MSQRSTEGFSTKEGLLAAVEKIMPAKDGVYLPCNLVVTGAESILESEERAISFVSQGCVLRWLTEYDYIFSLDGVSVHIDIPKTSKS